MENNIDEDIKIVKEIKRSSLTGGFDKQTIRLRAISNILSELEIKQKDEENWKKIYKEEEESITEKNNKICDLEFKVDNLKSELETYKKIAEKLAEEVENLDDRLSAEIGNYTKGYCNIEDGCIFNYKRKCSECIIDWARKEVSNDK